MRNRIIEIVNQFSDISITGFKNQMPEIHGDLDFVFPMKNVENSNILLVSGVNKEFIKTIMDLINEEILTFVPTEPIVVAFDSAEMYDLPLATPKQGVKGYKSYHWLPLLIKEGAKFPKMEWKPFNEDDDDYYERQQEELQERAMECTCGAWKLGKSGEVYHVADCCCGAE